MANFELTKDTRIVAPMGDIWLIYHIGAHWGKRNISRVYSTGQCLYWSTYREVFHHYNDVIMSTIASQITSLTIVYSTVCSGTDQRKHQSSASLAFVRVIHRGPVNSPHKGPVTRKMFPFDDVIMTVVRAQQNVFPFLHLPILDTITSFSRC